MTPQALAQQVPLGSRWSQFHALTKPRVIRLIVFCALVGMLLSVPALPPLRLLLATALGIWLVASAAAAFNCLAEQHIDARMARTAWRPTASGALSPRETASFATALCLAGAWVLHTWVNPLTLWLTLATFLGYTVVYTLVLKPLTPQNIVIGGASGAMPPVLGWVAARGEVGPEALALFLIIFLWTPPHFWSLALYRAEEYRHSGLPMLPVTHGTPYTTRLMLYYTVALLGATLLPFGLGLSGPVYLLAAIGLGAVFMLYVVMLKRQYSHEMARATFRHSIVYLSLLFAALLLDHYLSPWLFGA